MDSKSNKVATRESIVRMSTSNSMIYYNALTLSIVQKRLLSLLPFIFPTKYLERSALASPSTPHTPSSGSAGPFRIPPMMKDCGNY